MSRVDRILLLLAITDTTGGAGDTTAWRMRGRLLCEGRPDIIWARHDKYTMAPGEVRKLLLKEAGLSVDEAKEVLG